VAPRVLDLNATVAGTLKMLRRLIGENVTLTWQPGVDLWPVRLDPSQVSQILANLAVNARDAIAGVGHLRIRTGTIAVDAAGAARHADRVAGDYVLLVVSDDGRGMEAHELEHLFEPFFTTKGAGKGTGLGLAVVFGIVSEHGGRLEVESELGQGSCFRVVLPARSGEAATAPTEALEDTVPPGRGERLLLVEDEEGSRKALAELLELLDYHVTSVGSGEEAGRLPAEPGFDLLLTDLMLPGITGVDMAAGLVERWPRLVVVVMSGYTADVLDRYKVDSGTMHFLEKPFDLHVLARKLREALGSR